MVQHQGVWQPFRNGATFECGATPRRIYESARNAF
jgi:hypothetical protein